MENEKSKVDRIRDSAYSITVKKRDEIESDPILEMLTVKGMMLLVKQKSIFRIQLPDDSDPERKRIDTKGSASELYSIGSTSPIVARTLLQAKRLLEFAPLDKVTQEQLLDMSDTLQCGSQTSFQQQRSSI